VRKARRSPHPRAFVSMQSNGRILASQAVALTGSNDFFSQAPGGVLGAQYLSGLRGFDRIITF